MVNQPVNFETASDPGVINLGPGQPSSDLLPVDLLEEATRRYFAGADPRELNYGDKQGDAHFRAAVAKLLSGDSGRPVDPGHLMLSAGNSQALDFVTRQLTRPGDTVFVEEPTYFLAYRIFRDHGLDIVGIPVDGQGMDLGRLEALLPRHRPRLVYTIPSYHNPTGQLLPEERRERLATLSREHGFVIAADEPYQLLYYGEPPPPALGAYADLGNVVSLGSFSKILAPGTRLGWIQTNPELLETLLADGAVCSGGSFNHFTSHLVRCAIESGQQARFIEHLRRVYRARVATMDAALETHFGGRARWLTPGGGYFFWLELEEGLDTSAYKTRALAAGTGFLPGRLFSCQDGLRHCLRLSFAPFGEAEIERGVERLARVFRE